jgi:hypothetical protein
VQLEGKRRYCRIANDWTKVQLLDGANSIIGGRQRK